MHSTHRVLTAKEAPVSQAMELLMPPLLDTLDQTMLTMEHTLVDMEPSDGTLTTLSSWDLVLDMDVNHLHDHASQPVDSINQGL